MVVIRLHVLANVQPMKVITVLISLLIQSAEHSCSSLPIHKKIKFLFHIIYQAYSLLSNMFVQAGFVSILVGNRQDNVNLCNANAPDD